MQGGRVGRFAGGSGGLMQMVRHDLAVLMYYAVEAVLYHIAMLFCFENSSMLIN